MTKIRSIEGLRGYLALWVIVSHILAFSGLEAQLPQSLALLKQGGLAVDVFVIISGFVITLLLTRKQENYFYYLKRRFLRLFPLFLVMLLISTAINPIFNQNLLSLQGNLSSDFIDFFIERSRLWWSQPATYLITAVSLFHGLIPESLLPHASTTFLGQGWSLSLEWQFYIVAPLLVSMLAPPARLTKVVAGAIAILAIKQLYPTVGYGAALPNHIEYFIIGILSFFAFQTITSSTQVWVNRKSDNGIAAIPEFPWLGTCFTICLFILLIGNSMELLPLAIWAVVLVQSMELEQSPLSQATRFLFQNPVSLYIGKISYSLYLSHMIVLTIVQKILIQLNFHQNLLRNGIALAFFTLAGSVVLSHITYHYIELKGTAFGEILRTNPKSLN